MLNDQLNYKLKVLIYEKSPMGYIEFFQKLCLILNVHPKNLRLLKKTAVKKIYWLYILDHSTQYQIIINKTNIF